MATNHPRDFALLLGQFESLSQAVEFTKNAENYGYNAVSMGETTGRNVPVILGHLAAQTTDLGITDSVLSPYARTPTLLGQTAATLQEMSEGRFRLSIGASSPALAEYWHGVEFDRPLRRLRETIEIVRQVQTGDRVSYDGDIYTPNGLQLTSPAPDPPAPIDVAALGPKATEMTGRFADGWVPQLLPYELLKERLDDLRRGCELGDRDPSDVRVAYTIRCGALEDREQAREYARAQLAFMIAAYGPFYRQAIAEAGWDSLVDTVIDRWNEGERGDAIAAISDELVDSVAAAGTPEEVREQVARFEAIDGVDAVIVSFFGQMSVDEQSQTIEALAPEP